MVFYIYYVAHLVILGIIGSVRAHEENELLTSSKSVRNLYLYKKLGYKEYKRKNVSGNIEMIYLEK